MINEIDIMRALDHENVIKLYEVYETEKSIYLVLELIQGKSLQEVLKKGMFRDNEARITNVISSIIEALGYLASRGVMHRDLKPDNILLDKGDKVKIVDFGLATFIDLPEYIFKKCGTPGYIAPEVFKYDPKVATTSYDHHCDVFSAGCILYYMIFGTAFFDGANASEILKSNRRFAVDFHAINNVKQEIKNPSSRISKDALDLLLKLLEFDQKRRPAAAESLNHPYLFAVVQQKFAGSYNFYEYGGVSPTIRDKRGSLAQDFSYQSKGTLPTNTQRFAEKDSLYLDLGKPEINGRVDTLTNGSNNNSLMLFRADSFNGASPKSTSPFAKGTPQTSSFRVYANNANGGNSPTVGNQTFLKAAIHRNIQNNNDEEEYKQSNFIKLHEVKHERRSSDFVTTNHGSFKSALAHEDRAYSDEMDDVSQENPQIYKNLEKLKLEIQPKHPSKLVEPNSARLGYSSFGKNY